MDRNRTTQQQLEKEMQKAYLQYFQKRLEEYRKNRLTGRLVIDIQKGEINSIQDQAIVAGNSALHVYSRKIVE